MIKIQNADLADQAQAEAVVFLLDAYARDPMGGGHGLSEYTKSHLAEELQSRNAVVLLAYVDGKPAGLTNCFEGFSTFQCKPLLNIHDIAVLPEYRRRGIASRLLEEVEAIARERGCCKLTLEVLEGNKAAQAAYARFGFDGYQLDETTGKALFWEKKL